MDIGRDVNFMAEAAGAAGIQLICATGLYKEDLGNTAYFKQRPVGEIAEAYVAELTEGIARTGVKAGVIKCATSKDKVTEYKRSVTARRRPRASQDRRAHHPHPYRRRHDGPGAARHFCRRGR